MQGSWKWYKRVNILYWQISNGCRILLYCHFKLIVKPSFVGANSIPSAGIWKEVSRLGREILPPISCNCSYPYTKLQIFLLAYWPSGRLFGPLILWLMGRPASQREIWCTDSNIGSNIMYKISLDTISFSRREGDISLFFVVHWRYVILQLFTPCSTKIGKGSQQFIFIGAILHYGPRKMPRTVRTGTRPFGMYLIRQCGSWHMFLQLSSSHFNLVCAHLQEVCNHGDRSIFFTKLSNLLSSQQPQNLDFSDQHYL